jgi:hypothetical protein
MAVVGNRQLRLCQSYQGIQPAHLFLDRGAPGGCQAIGAAAFVLAFSDGLDFVDEARGLQSLEGPVKGAGPRRELVRKTSFMICMMR